MGTDCGNGGGEDGAGESKGGNWGKCVQWKYSHRRNPIKAGFPSELYPQLKLE